MKRGERNTPRGVVLHSVFIFLLLAWCPSHSSAFAPPKHISQLGHTAWRLQDGLFSGVPSAIAQTVDGYLWIGTSNGLTRFDGVRFVPWTPPAGATFPNLNVIALLGSSDGSLWIGTSGGFARLKNGIATTYPDKGGRVSQMVEDKSGSIWIGQTRVAHPGEPLCQVVGLAAHCFGKTGGVPAPYVSTLATDPRGYLWLGHSSSVTQWAAGSGTTFEIPKLHATEGLEGIGATLVNQDGSVLVGLARAGSGLGLQRLIDGHWQSFMAPGLDGSTLQVSALHRARNGSLWIGTVDDGIFHVQDDSVDHYRSTDGLSSDGVNQIFEDHEGDVWVATSLGVDRFRDVKVTTYSRTEGLSANVVQSVAAGRDGTVWIGNFGALDSIKNGQIASLTPKAGLPGIRVTSLLEDAAGTLWVGVDNQLYVYEHQHFARITPRGRPQLGTVISMTQDTAGDLWVLTANPLSLLHIHGRTIVEDQAAASVPPALSVAASGQGGIFLGLIDGRLAELRGGKLETFTLWSPNSNHDRIGSLVSNADGSMWGDSAGGLIGWRNGRTEVLGEKNGLPCKRVNGLVKAKNGDLWLSQPCGFTRIPHEQLDASWDSPSPALKVETLDVFDGAQTGRSVFAPTATASPDGKLWFANETLLQMIDPAELSANSFVPPVHIEEITADHRAYPPSRALELPAHTRDLEIDYTALSLGIPQKVRFRYKLEGWDIEWQDAGTRRQAFYMNLGPRSYTFRVMASNGDGVWNESEAALGFAIAPAFYQTRWFYFGSILTVVFALYSLYWLRLRQITAQMKERMLERLSERERIARDLHDSFFQGIQGLLLMFNSGTSQLDPKEPARAILVQALEQSDRVMLEGRELVLDLRAVATDTLELPESLAKAGEEFKSLGDAEFRVTVIGHSRPLNGMCANELYRIGREALYNAFLHAHASSIEVELHYESERLRLRVTDNGVGIDEQVVRDGVRAGHWGLPGMQERAQKLDAKLMIWSRKGSGTEIEVAVSATVAYLPVDTMLLAAWRIGWMRKIRPFLGGTHG
jgi:signal transduction histidine kinase/ligand-binding sensor domain-containing protein